MPKERNKQKQLWSDIEFINVLERIKAKRLLNGKPVKNLGQLTEEILKCPSFKQIEAELINADIRLNAKLKLDNKELFQ